MGKHKPPRFAACVYNKNPGLLQMTPFIGEIHVHTCDHHGAILSLHDITVTIPPGAIPVGVTEHIEMGVALYGPFKFPANHQPVSPILWFCLQEDIELLLPITFRLPHVITDTGRVKLNFVKINHLDYVYDSATKRDFFTFEAVSDSKSSFINPTEKSAGYGYLSTKHRCFFCISAENEGKMTKNLALEKGYCLHILAEKIDSSSCRILLVCTYFLKTCLEVKILILLL